MERCSSRKKKLISTWPRENPSHCSEKGQGETEGQVGKDRMAEINSFADVQEATVRVNNKWILNVKKRTYMKYVKAFWHFTSIKTFLYSIHLTLGLAILHYTCV